MGKEEAIAEGEGLGLDTRGGREDEWAPPAGGFGGGNARKC